MILGRMNLLGMSSVKASYIRVPSMKETNFPPKSTYGLSGCKSQAPIFKLIWLSFGIIDISDGSDV